MIQVKMLHHIIGEYDNGNYHVKIYDDGTKIRETFADNFIPNFPESIDLNITNKCDGCCDHCYMDSNENGEHADLMRYIPILNSLQPYTEVAINGNDLSHPDLEKFLIMLKEKKVIVNMTVNQLHFERLNDKIKRYIELGYIHGLGVSLIYPSPKFIELATDKIFKNLVIHVVHGMIRISLLVPLYHRGLKILILGYKKIGRGKDFYMANKDLIVERQTEIEDNLQSIVDGFDVVSFDNLAIKQLDLKNKMSKFECIEKFGKNIDNGVYDYDSIYMGDDGQFTFYVDLVKGTYSSSSLEIENPLETFGIITGDTIQTMFSKVNQCKLFNTKHTFEKELERILKLPHFDTFCGSFKNESKVVENPCTEPAENSNMLY